MYSYKNLVNRNKWPDGFGGRDQIYLLLVQTVGIGQCRYVYLKKNKYTYNI